MKASSACSNLSPNEDEDNGYCMDQYINFLVHLQPNLSVGSCRVLNIQHSNFPNIMKQIPEETFYFVSQESRFANQK